MQISLYSIFVVHWDHCLLFHTRHPEADTQLNSVRTLLVHGCEKLSSNKQWSTTATLFRSLCLFTLMDCIYVTASWETSTKSISTHALAWPTLLFSQVIHYPQDIWWALRHDCHQSWKVLQVLHLFFFAGLNPTEWSWPRSPPPLYNSASGWHLPSNSTLEVFLWVSRLANNKHRNYCPELSSIEQTNPYSKRGM